VPASLTWNCDTPAQALQSPSHGLKHCMSRSTTIRQRDPLPDAARLVSAHICAMAPAGRTISAQHIGSTTALHACECLFDPNELSFNYNKSSQLEDNFSKLQSEAMCVPDVIGGLAVWWHNKPKTKNHLPPKLGSSLSYRLRPPLLLRTICMLS